MLLLHDRDWEPPIDEEQPRRARSWHLPWRPLAWFAVWAWLMALVPTISGWWGNLAGYGVLVLSIALVLWRLDRLCQHLNWTGLRDYKS
jgi:hypothetical protein